MARSNALLLALETGNKPQLIRPPEVEEAVFQEAISLLTGQMSEYSAKLNRLEAGIATRQAERISTQALVHKFQQTVPIAKQKREDIKQLVDKNYASAHDYLASEQTFIEQEADLSHEQSRLKEIEATLREARSQRAELTAQTRRMTLDSLTEGQQKASTLEQELRKAQSRGKLMQLTSPVEGTVQQLATHTIGGVVTPAQPVMLIVPQDQAVEVEAFIENKDIGFVNPDQEAEVKIETFQYTKYGTIKAHVTSVSHDAINDEKRGLIYSTRVKMNQSTIQVEGKSVNLSPGMAVSVEIKTGKRRVIDYFLSPLIQHTSESLRER